LSSDHLQEALLPMLDCWQPVGNNLGWSTGTVVNERMTEPRWIVSYPKSRPVLFEQNMKPLLEEQQEYWEAAERPPPLYPSRDNLIKH